MPDDETPSAGGGRTRYVRLATPGAPVLGPLKHLPGTWGNLPNLPGRGWNMIALPFPTPGGPGNFRLLVNQFDETLKFTLVDDDIPNRGIKRVGGVVSEDDQFVVSLDYKQLIAQIAADDFPSSGGLAGGPNLAIHHEPGLWIHMPKEAGDGHDLARLSTIPHGDSVLALGDSTLVPGSEVTVDLIPERVNGLPVGVPQDIELPYLAPYKHYHDAPFLGLFDPTKPTDLLRGALQGIIDEGEKPGGAKIVQTTVLEVDTTIDTGGISNIPFVVKQANASDMKSTFWIHELDEKDAEGNPKLILQYLQIVNLDFFNRFDGAAGRIKWPHISINTMEKVVAKPDGLAALMPHAEAEEPGGGN